MATITLEWRDFIDAMVMHVSKMIETANRTNRFTADICDYRAAYWLDHAEQQFAKHNLYHYRVALRRSQYYQRGAALARETGRKVMQVNAGREYGADWRATEPTPGALLKGSSIDPDDYQYELDYDAGIISGTWPNNG